MNIKRKLELRMTSEEVKAIIAKYANDNCGYYFNNFQVSAKDVTLDANHTAEITKEV